MEATPSITAGPRRRRILFVLLWLAVIPVGPAVYLVFEGFGSYGVAHGIALLAVALFGLTGANAVSDGIQLLRLHGGRERADPRRGQVHAWQILKASSIFLNLLLILAFVALVGAVMLRAGFLDRDVTPETVIQVGILFGSILTLNGTLALWKSLQTPLSLDRSTLARAMHWIAASATVAAAIGAILVAWTSKETMVTGLAAGDAPVLFLAAATFAVLDLFVVRSLPTAYILLSEERTIYEGQTYFNRAKSVIAPTLGAFALMFLVLLAFMVISGTSSGAFEDARNSPIFLGMVGITLIALIISVAAATFLARAEDKFVLYRPQENRRERIGDGILLVSILVALVVVGLAVAVKTGTDVLGIPPDRWVDMTALGILVGVGPYGFWIAQEHRRIRSLEQRFPDFLRDVASSHRGGLTLPNAVAIAARGEYGPLSEEIQRMADQMTWNVPFSEALTRFKDRVQTPLIERAVNLILEADRSGGSTSDVLLAAARDAREIKNMEDERGVAMSMYTVIIYITFGVFLVVAAVLFNDFVPQIIASSEAAQASSLGGASQFSAEGVGIDDSRSFYFIAALVQAAGGGIVAGMMGTGRALLGLRHSFAMVLITTVTFTFLLA